MLLWFGCTWMAMFFALACLTLAFLAVRREVIGLRRGELEGAPGAFGAISAKVLSGRYRLYVSDLDIRMSCASYACKSRPPMNNCILSVLVTAAIALTISTAEARIAYYNCTASATVTGGGAQVSPASSGVLVLDLDTWQATAITAVSFKIGKRTTTSFGIVPLENYLFTTVLGPRGVVYSVFAKAEAPSTQFKNFILEGNLMVGANSWQKISYAYGTESLPAKLTSVGVNILSQSGYDFLTQGTATYTLNTKASLAYNTYNSSVDQIIAAIRAQYLSRGYSETIIEPATP